MFLSGVPIAIGEIVKYCLEKKILFKTMKLDEFKRFHPKFEADIYEKIKPKNVVKSRISVGGTGFAQVEIELNNWEKKLLL